LRVQAEARMAVFDFVEGWYNPRRRHSVLSDRR
jgi:putative transposase